MIAGAMIARTMMTRPMVAWAISIWGKIARAMTNRAIRMQGKPMSGETMQRIRWPRAARRGGTRPRMIWPGMRRGMTRGRVFASGPFPRFEDRPLDTPVPGGMASRGPRPCGRRRGAAQEIGAAGVIRGRHVRRREGAA